MPEAFHLHQDYSQPIAAGLAQALSGRGELNVEVTFDTAVQDPETFIYVDLITAAGGQRLHLSVRIKDKLVLLNTQQAGVWGEAVAVDIDFTPLRHWRLWLVLAPDGLFSVKLGQITLCQLATRVRPQNIVTVAGNASHRCALRMAEPSIGLSGVFDSATQTALIHGALPEDFDPALLAFSVADRPIALDRMTPAVIAGQPWLACRLSQADLAEAGPGEMGILVTGPEGDFRVHDVLSHPIVEISQGDIVLRGVTQAPLEDVFWRCRETGAQTATRLVTSGPALSGGRGPGFVRFITPLSEFLRLIPTPEDLAPTAPNVLDLHVAGLAPAPYGIAIGPAIYVQLEALARAAVDGGWAETAEWRMVFMDWWSVLHAPEHLPLIKKVAPFLSDFLAKQRQFAGAVLSLEEAAPPARVEAPAAELVAFWRAVRSVGDLLATPDVSAEALRRHVLYLAGLMRADERHFFMLEISDVLLEFGLAEVISAEIAEGFVADLITPDKSAWQLSAALAPLAARKRIEECVSVLLRLSKLPDTGFNHRAISAAVVAIVKAKLPRDLRFKAAYAYLEFLKSLGSQEYASFRHAGLMRALVLIILASSDEPDWFQTDMMSFAEKHFATVPEFWSLFEAERRATTRPGGIFMERFVEMAGTAMRNNAALAGFRALTGDPAAERPALRIVAEGARRDYLDTFLSLHGLKDPTHSGSLSNTALSEDIFLRTAAHPFPDAGAATQSRLPPRALRDAVLRLQSFPMVEYRSLLENIGQAALAGDVERLCDFLPLCSEGGPTGDPATNAVVLDAITWGLLAAKRDDGALLGALIVQILDRLRTAPDATAVPPGLHAAVRRLTQAARAGDLDTLTLRQIEALDEVYRDRFPLAEDEAPQSDLPAGGFFGDTLIALITCRKYLETRAKECRETWIKDVEAAGAKVLFFCGSDDINGAAEVDEATGVVTLPVGDAYEDLPAKVLAIFRWIRQNRPESYVLKIDDDCYLDAKTFLTSLSYRRSHYFGRPLTAFPATFDRAWHQAKSARPGNQRAIDTSPLGTRYADGGGSYVLSRHALDQLEQVADSSMGVRLRLASYFEDKMIGDLLQAGGIQVSDMGYTSMQARRTHGGALPVLQIDRTFVPSALSGIAVAHLDTMGLMAQIRDDREGDAAGVPKLWPPRLWPMNAKPSLAYDSNMLEMLNPQGAREKIENAEFVCVCALRNEMTILPHFLAHYRKLGVQVFLIADNLSDDGTREFLHGQPDVVLFSAANDYKVSHYGVDWQRVLLDHFCAGRWVVVADADEFLLTRDNTPETQPGALPALCRSLEAEGHDAALAMMADMYPEGALEAADFAQFAPAETARCYDRVPVRRWSFNRGPFGNLGSYVSGLRHRLMPLSPPERFTAQKVAVFRFNPLMSFSEGFHFGTGLRFSPQPLAFLHYKYSAEFAAKARLEALRGQHFGGGVEYRAYLALVEQGLTSLWREGISETLDLTSPGALDRVLAGVVPPFAV